MIVATAGHVDHGKTTLVKALTGIDTDRLSEEKRRGLSIDLGFAHADLGDGTRVGFVDVPGHERFIRNMVARVASIDCALLVVAADDGPMPQTVEHLEILEWLGVARGLVAITKVDRVAPERLAEVGFALDALLAHGPFRTAPRFPVVATRGIGVEAVREQLRREASSRVPRAPTGRFRLAVDRSFTLAGAGHVVTGAVVAGSVRIGDALTVSPQGTAVRVRGIEVHHVASDQAQAGQRCALNLAGADLKRTTIGRGDWIVDPAAHAPTDRLDVRLGAGRGLDRPLAHDQVVQLHLAAAAVPARLALLEGRRVEPGMSALAQLVLMRPIGALHGDRYIVRDPSAGGTLGGGAVIDPIGRPRGRARPERLAQLAALEGADPRAALDAMLGAAPEGLDPTPFFRARNLGDAEAEALCRASALILLEADGDGSGSARVALAPVHWNALRERILAALDTVHASEPERLGHSESELASTLAPKRQVPALRAAVRSLQRDGALVRDGFCLRRTGHVPRLSATDTERLQRLHRVLEAARLRPPIVGELATTLGVPLPALLVQLGDFARRGHLVQVAKNRYFLPATVAELADIAHSLATDSPEGTFDAAAYRDRSGLGRNLTIEVLEFLDRCGTTRFHAGRRRLIDERAC